VVDCAVTDDEYQQEPTSDGKKKKKRIKFKGRRLVLNVRETKYHMIRYVGKHLFGMRLSNFRCVEQDPDDQHVWDVLWTDEGVPVDRLYKMKPFQRINHFPGMYTLARKDHLARNLNKMQKRFETDYKFFPQTWLLPAEFGDFRKQFKENTKGKPGRKTFIVKPEASCQGKGVFLTRNLEDFTPNEHYVVQRYMHKPLLIDNLKFDLRIYILLCGVDPLRVYFYREGLCRLATQEY
jgi:tubulin polyglutamylase TTLL6/13